MADSDDGSVRLRESHYNQQRSSPRSDRSLHTPSRPQSSQLLQDFTLREDGEDPREAASPSPVIPRRKQSLDNGKRGSGHSRRGSSRATTRDGRTGSRGRTIDEYLAPDNFVNLTEVAAPPILDLRRHSTLEEERESSRAAKRSRRSSLRSSPLSRRGTPATDLDITALPVIPDAENAPKDSSDEYVATKTSPGRQRASRFATELYTVSHLIIFSILGTLARLGLQWLTFYPGAPVGFSELWANFGGTFFMGFLAEDRRLFRQEWGRGDSNEFMDDEERAISLSSTAKASHARVKKTIPLYIGLATGFCGSFTSFSSFMRDTFFALSNDLPTPINHPYPPGIPQPSITTTIHRNGGYSFMAVCAVIITTVALCYSALRFGAHTAIYMDGFTPTLPFRFVRRVVDPIIVIIAWGAWVGAVIMAVWPPDRPGGPQGKGSWANESWRGQAIFACVFAPVGCLLRFYVSLKLNAVIPSFPLGTFAVNIFGTAVLGMAYDLQHVEINGVGVGGGRVGCQIFQGIMDGFCGALTTVSTWMLELSTLKRGHSYSYGVTSTCAGLGILVAVMGSVRWTVGWTAAACVT